nr:ankyrin repeat domain-containing protein [Prescottella equi]
MSEESPDRRDGGEPADVQELAVDCFDMARTGDAATLAQ